MDQFPQSLPASWTPGAPVWRQLPDMYALHGVAPPANAKVISEFSDEGIVICAGAAADVLAAEVTPAFALNDDDSPAAPTGRVLIRFDERIAVADKSQAIEDAGYRIESILDYAPQAAWVRSACGGIAASLSGIAALSAIDDVCHVEPQMLQPRMHRPAGGRLRSPP